MKKGRKIKTNRIYKNERGIRVKRKQTSYEPGKA